MTIPLPNGTRAFIPPGHVTTMEKSLGVWPTIDGNDSKHIEENAERTLTGAHGLDSIQVQTMGRNSIWYCHTSHHINRDAGSPPYRELSLPFLPGH
jgi:hypothetical protein